MASLIEQAYSAWGQKSTGGRADQCDSGDARRGQIAIAAYSEAEEAVITVRDHGRGIPRLIAGSIFDPFLSTRDNALGLGLAVSRQIAAAHCGNITAAEISDKGTCISMRLCLNPRDIYEERPHIGGRR